MTRLNDIQERQLIGELLKIPNIHDAGMLNLVFGYVPTSIRDEISGNFNSSWQPAFYLSTLVKSLNGPGAQRTDGSWPIIGFMQAVIGAWSTAAFSGEIQKLLDIAERPTPVAGGLDGADAFAVCCLRYGNMPFVNRERLRARLKDLCEVAGRYVLVINGGSYSGKTYSRWYIYHLREWYKDVRQYSVYYLNLKTEFRDEALIKLDVPTLSYRIATELELDVGDIDAFNLKHGSFATLFARWVVRETTTRGTVSWLILDGVAEIVQKRPDIKLELLDLLLTLVRRLLNVPTEIQGSGLRLVLIEFPRIELLLEDEMLNLIHEDTTPEQIERNPLVAFFSKLYGGVGGLSEADAQSHAESDVGMLLTNLTDQEITTRRSFWESVKARYEELRQAQV